MLVFMKSVKASISKQISNEDKHLILAYKWWNRKSDDFFVSSIFFNI